MYTIMMLKALVQRLLNLSPREGARTVYAWLIRLLLKIGIVAGWTSVVAMFVTRYSVSSLPLLFLFQAIFTMLGMLLFSFLLERFQVKTLIAISSLLAAVTFFGAALFNKHELIFFALSIVGHGMFLPQVIIFLSNYLEDFFTPWDCPRLFPLIESAETIGGIIGGLVLANAGLELMGHKMLYLWVVLIFLFLAVVYVLEPKKTPYYDKYGVATCKKGSCINLDGLYQGLQEIKRIPFLQVLMMVFFVQWMIAHLLEFQFTKSIDEMIGTGVSLNEHEASLIHGLGSFQVILHIFALVVQLLLGSRILKFLGIFGGFVLHSLVTLLSVVSLYLGFNYFTALLARNNFEATTIIHKNSYEAVYYGFRHGAQRPVREFFEGLVLPLATVASTLILFAIQAFFIQAHFLPVVQLFLFFAAISMTYFSFHLQKNYISMVRRQLLYSPEKNAILHAVEILAQNGHKDSSKVLREGFEKCGDPEVKRKIVRALAMIEDQK